LSTDARGDNQPPTRIDARAIPPKVKAAGVRHLRMNDGKAVRLREYVLQPDRGV